MSGLDRLLALALQNKHQKMALATVTNTWGSAPRPRGSHMLVLESGRFEGSVSGGCVENAVLEEAAETIANGGFRKLCYGVSNDAAWAVGLPCGGTIEVMVQSVSADGFAPELFERLRTAQRDNEQVRLVTDGHGHTSEDTGVAGFENLYAAPRRLLIVGAVQIAQSLAKMAQEIELKVTVIDPRATYLTAERFPGIAHDTRWPDTAIEALKPNSRTAVITLSHDIKLDDPALAAALRMPTGYIAALGSRKSHAARLERLSGQGFDAASLQRIEGPAGIDIGAIGPAEIALSILAGTIRRLSVKPVEDVAPNPVALPKQTTAIQL